MTRSRRSLVRAGTVLLWLAVSPLRAADRDAETITPGNSPVSFDEGRAFLFDTPSISVSVRNTHTAPLLFTLGVWLFTERGELRGVASYCEPQALDRGMRGRFLIPIEVRDVTLRDHAVVTVASAVSGATSWTLHESADEQLEAARAASRGAFARLVLDRHEATEAIALACPCDCPTIQSACAGVCRQTGLAAFSCAPVFGSGCSAGCSCQ
jgi:hypothetical protein